MNTPWSAPPAYKPFRPSTVSNNVGEPVYGEHGPLKRKRLNTDYEAPQTQPVPLTNGIPGPSRQHQVAPRVSHIPVVDNHDATLIQKKGLSRKPKIYDSETALMHDLNSCFKYGRLVDFTGSYSIVNSPPMSDKLRVQWVVHEIWRHTGYRFTVKDHPLIKDGHKTRLWCSQDVARKHKPRSHDSKSRISLAGDPLAKERFPCKSRLLVSSREGVNCTSRIVTIRLYHEAEHEPYGFKDIDSAKPPPPASASSIWSAPPEEDFDAIDNLPPEIQPEFDRKYEMDEHFASGGEEEADNAETPAESEPGPVHTEQLPSIPTPQEIFQRRMRAHVANIREFCDGLEYQIQFGDYRMLEELEKSGTAFFALVKDCLSNEGRFNADADLR